MGWVLVLVWLLYFVGVVNSIQNMDAIVEMGCCIRGVVVHIFNVL